jgi:hypothetical protein
MGRIVGKTIKKMRNRKSLRSAAGDGHGRLATYNFQPDTWQ